MLIFSERWLAGFSLGHALCCRLFLVFEFIECCNERLDVAPSLNTGVLFLVFSAGDERE